MGAGQGEDTATLEGDLPDLEIVYSSQLDCRRRSGESGQDMSCDCHACSP